MSRQLIDIEKFREQGFGDVQTALAYCEEGLGLEFNVSPYGVIRRGDIFFDSETGNEICLDQEMEFGVEERQGMMNMFVLAEKGADTLYWISPSGGSYVDARLVVARVIKKESDEIELECRGIVCKHDPDTLFQIATRMVGIEDGMIENWVSNAEGLRSQPIGFRLEEKDWIEFSEKMFGMEKVWQAIKTGEDVIQKEKIKGTVILARSEVMARGYTGRELTVQFELEMVRRGYRLSEVGNHGGSSLRSMSKLSVFDTVFSSSAIRIDANGEVKHKCSDCGHWYTGDHCPYCS